MTSSKDKYSIIEKYHAFLSGYEENKKNKSKNPYQKDSELHFFYSIGRRHKGEVDVGASRKRSYGHSDR